MRVFRSIKYVITAAAVCILCFSGNSQYVYAVFTITPENDIVEQPDNVKSLENNVEKICRAKKYKYFIRCISQPDCNGFKNQNFSNELQPELNRCSKIVIASIDEFVNKLFIDSLHGNRSP